MESALEFLVIVFFFPLSLRDGPLIFLPDPYRIFRNVPMVHLDVSLEGSKKLELFFYLVKRTFFPFLSFFL